MKGYLHFAIAKDGTACGLKTGFNGFDEGEIANLKANFEFDHGGLALTLNKERALKLAATILKKITEEEP